ncbi:MAG: MBL fold metallo-hydrolase [Elusimicrobiota bacterium]
MRIRWFGQACMVLNTADGITVVCDPYDDSYGYVMPADKADIITVSHDHTDHNASWRIQGEPTVIKGAGKYSEYGISMTGVSTWHDNEGGRSRGSNTVFNIRIDNINFVHMGDIGHVLEKHQAEMLRPCDILAVPVGGVFTVDWEGAARIVEQLDPRIVIPIHYHTPSSRLRIDTHEKFTGRFLETRSMELWDGNRSDIPENITVCLLQPCGEVKETFEKKSIV